MSSTKTINSLPNLIKYLQEKIKYKKLDENSLKESLKTLKAIGFKLYDEIKFPPLTNTSIFSSNTKSSPENLAEALLWKMGKWSVYKKFAQNFGNKNLKVSSDGGVVFSAFAKHLQDNSNPIYDQHAIRAIWALCELRQDEQEKCEKLLFKSKGGWKDSGSEDDGSCYEIFCKYLKLLSMQSKLNNKQLDSLLMPLGQAIKKYSSKEAATNKSSDKAEFNRLRHLDHKKTEISGSFESTSKTKESGHEKNKMTCAIRVYNENPKEQRKHILEKFINQCGLTPKGASTYYHKIKKESA